MTFFKTFPSIFLLHAMNSSSFAHTLSQENIVKFDLLWELFWALGAIVFVLSYRYFTTKKLSKELDRRLELELLQSEMTNKMTYHQNKLISMGEMIENIAHQWRQPLSQINSAVLVVDELLHEKGVKDINIEEKLLEIESLTRYMSKTIDDFKDFFSKNKNKETFYVQELIEKSVYIVKGTLKANNIEIQINADKNITCHGYANELQQVIVVILNNAKDMFISRNIFKPKIEIDVKKFDENLEIIICDNAGGISPSIVDKIFEPYFTTKHKSQGTGLGLYISKMIIEESMGGLLYVTPLKQGTCFHIDLKDRND